MYKQIDVNLWKEMIVYGGRFLELNRALIDSLNVFPVPDGDTGTNMSRTYGSALAEVEGLQEVNMENVCEAFARGALKGARGNSGVILSQIIKGICEILKQKDAFNSRDFSKALKRGTEIAYLAVTKPKEGTILTVVRVVAEQSAKPTVMLTNFTEFSKRLVIRGEDILKRTKEMLPVLKKADTVDAGGMGLLTILKGFSARLHDEALPELTEAPEQSHEETPLMTPKYEQLDEITFGYCNEFFIINLKKKTTLVDIDKLRDKLNAIGDSVLVIGDLHMVKVHVHSNNPNTVLAYALQLGELENIKIENMREQARQLVAKASPKKEHVAQAMISVSNGDGIRNISTELGVATVIDGGQTMNPSVDDILKSIREVNADAVIILPNNKNIVLAAEQAKELAECEVYIVPTVCIQQGIRAMMSFNPSVDVATNYENMMSGYDVLTCVEITYAIKDTVMDEKEIHNGDIIGIGNKRILSTGTDVLQVLLDVCEQTGVGKADSMTLYYGNGMTDQDAADATQALCDIYPDLEIMALNGGQQHYYYLISFE